MKAEATSALTPHARLRKVAVVANPASGSVGPTAPGEAQAILEGFGIEATIAAPEPEGLEAALKLAVEGKPDLLVVLAGDGTARTAAALCGPDGPLVAPLPGGTMNMLPKALYGARDWKAALTDTLAQGVPTPVGGGEVSGQPFFVAAILGAPALFAEAREAARKRLLGEAVRRVMRAYSRAFSSRLRYAFDGRAAGKAEALTLMCPLISRAVDDETSLEAAAFTLSGAGEALRLGVRAALAGLPGDTFGDWRDDPSVSLSRCRKGEVWSRNPIPAILDGEPTRLGRKAEIRFRPAAFRALVPPAAATG